MDDIQTLFIKDTSTNTTYFFKGYTSGQISKPSVVSSYPTVEGTAMVDHVYRDLNDVTISLEVSDINSAGRYVYYTDGGYQQGSIAELRKLIESWQSNGTLLDIQTRFEQFTNMCISSVTISESDDNYGLFSPRIRFNECRRVHINTVMLGPFATTKARAENVEETSTANAATIAGGVIGSIAVSAAAGAAVGSLGGGIGMAIGAGIGAIGGALHYCGKYFGWW